jgi:tetratricopeptide (TPR) repeat protein
MYDPEANYVYGVAARRNGALTDAKETLGWAARSLEFRSMAYTQLAEIAVIEQDPDRAVQFADLALAADQDNLSAREVRAAAYRKGGDLPSASDALDDLLGIDPLDHLARFERYLLDPSEPALAEFKGMVRSELPHETYLELALFYARLGLSDDALTLLRNAPVHPEVRAWQAYLTKDRAAEEGRKLLDEALTLSPFLIFPFREESIPVFSWAIKERPEDWKPKYYLGLIYWGKGRIEEAAALFDACAQADFAPFFLARAALRREVAPERARADYERALALDPKAWRAWHALVDFERSQSKPERALETARRAAAAFPDEVPIRVDLVKALLDVGRFSEAADLLDKIEALPSEGASELHSLYVRAHLALAVEAMKAKDWPAALRELERSKEYPERLGTGAPFHPDVRLQDYLAAVCHERLGDAAKADVLRRGIADYTLTYWDEPQPHAYFGALVLERLGHKDKAAELRKRAATPAREILAVIGK